MRSILFIALTVLITSCSNAQQDGNSNFQDMNAKEAKEMLKENPELVIIDVRTDAECADGMIEGAKQIDISKPDFNEKIAELDKEGKYLMYCRSGGRSGRAQQIMKEMGFKEVYNLSGGYSSW